VSSLREQILGAKDVRMEPVEVPEWGVTVYVRAMGGDDLEAWEVGEYELREKVGERSILAFRSRLLAHCLCDADGTRLFKPEDAPALGKRDARALSRLVKVAKRLNGIGKAEEDALLGNSGGAPSGASGSS
jgi:hypothetical protein